MSSYRSDGDGGRTDAASPYATRTGYGAARARPRCRSPRSMPSGGRDGRARTRRAPRSCGSGRCELLRQLSEQTTRLVHQELELAKAELAEKGKQAGAGAAVRRGRRIGLAALGALTACFILALDTVMAAWLAALVVAVVYGIVALVLVKQGQARISGRPRRCPPRPSRR